MPRADNTTTSGHVPYRSDVPQEFVHKLDPDAVLLTGWRETGADAFEVTARCRLHRSLDPGRQWVHDPLLLSEMVRQLLPLLSHAAYDVPLGHHLIWDDFHYTFDPAALATRDSAELRLTVDCSGVTRRGTRVTSVPLRARIHCGAEYLGEAHTRFTIHSPTVYQRLRGAHGEAHRAMTDALRPALPLPASRVGRVSPYDVVLSPGMGPGRWQLCIDTSHADWFDHPVDHAPGMLLLEAARQAAQVVAYPQLVIPVAMRADFRSYVELDAPCWVDAEILPTDGDHRSRVRVSMRQHEKVCFTADVTPELVPSPLFPPALAETPLTGMHRTSVPAVRPSSRLVPSLR